MGSLLQETMALGIVIGASGFLVLRFFKQQIAPLCANWFLSQKQVRLAMLFRRLAGSSMTSTCSKCKSC